MSAIEMAGRVRRLPVVILIGMTLLIVGGVLDVAIHAASMSHQAHSAADDSHVGHIVAIAGMSVVLAGVAMHGVRRQRRRSTAPHGGLDRDANR